MRRCRRRCLWRRGWLVFFWLDVGGWFGGGVVWRGLTLEDEGEEVGGYENDGVINGF